MLAATRTALAGNAERFACLLETRADTSMPIPGSQWTVRDAAVHVAGANHRHLAYANGAGTLAPSIDKQHFDARTRSQIDDQPETDPKKLADEIRSGIAEFLAGTAAVPGDRLIAYHAGLRPTFARLSGILLGEYVLHGYDAAVALGVPWPIDPEEAALVVGAYRMTYGLTFHPPPPAAVTPPVTYRLDVPGTDPFVARIAEGAFAELPASSSADCVISADPVTALLVQAGRLNQWAAIALGLLRFTGHTPELGPRFAESFVFP